MATEKMRLTMHNGRKGKDGVFSPLHNDRNFDVANAEHIDENLSFQNAYYLFEELGIGDEKGFPSFEDYEKSFYEYYFSEDLNARNDRHRRSRHYERVMSMDDFRTNARYCPEEVIMQVGKVGTTIESDELRDICEEFFQWHKKQFPNIKLLDAALHVDEPDAAPHLHLRRVYTYTDEKSGALSVGQNKALALLGINCPKGNKSRSRYNNPKIPFTQMCRDKLAEICAEHGLDLELSPKEPTETGLDHLEYKRREEEKKLAKAVSEYKKTEQLIDEYTESKEKATSWKKFVEKYPAKTSPFGKLYYTKEQGEELLAMAYKYKTTSKKLKDKTAECDELAKQVETYKKAEKAREERQQEKFSESLHKAKSKATLDKGNKNRMYSTVLGIPENATYDEARRILKEKGLIARNGKSFELE